MLLAALFDLDGTLADSEPVLRAAQLDALRESGFSVEEQSLVALAGVPFIGTGGYPGRLDALGVPAQLQPDVDRRYRELLRAALPGTPAMDGAEDLLLRLSAAGLALALVSNKPEAGARALLEALGWTRYFAAVVGRDTPGSGPKPSAASIRTALRALDVAARSSAMIGDQPLDMEAGRDAQCGRVIGFTSTRPCELLRRHGATDCARTLREVGDLILVGPGGRARRG